MATPTTLPDALAEIEDLRGQVRDLLQLLGQEAKPRDAGGGASPVTTADAHEFSEGLVPKQAGKDAAQHLLNLHQMIETVPDIIFTLDLRGNLVGWNKRLQIVTGFTPQELNGRPALSFVPEHEHAQTAAAIQRAFEDGYAELEGHLLTNAQITIPYHWTGAALKNEDGRVIGITGVGRDVSEKKRIQTELQRQQQQLLSAQAFAHVGSWEWDVSSGNMEWSEEQFRIFGHEPGTISTTYEAFLAAVLPDDHDRVRTGISKTLMGQKSLDIECRIVRPTGEVRSIHCRGETVPDHTGHPARMSGSTLDITDRKQAESALRQSEAHFRALIENSSDIITVLDPDGTIRFESPSFERLLGYQQHEIDGRIAFDFIHPEDLPAVLEKFQLVVQRPGESQTAMFRFRHKDGSWLVLEGIGRSILDTEGQRCVIVNSRDVTERKRSEAALIRSHGLLTSFVEHTPAAVAMLDRDLRYVAVSRRWLQDYRLGDQNLIGRFHYDVFPEIRELEEWQAIHRRCLGGAVERREEDRFVRADGSEDWLRWEVRPWHDVTGSIGGLIMFTEVITERKRTENALRISQERYARATAIGKVGVWELDAVTGLYHGDINLKALLGYEPDELSTDPYLWLGLVHPEDQSIALKAWEGIISGSTDDYYYELRMIRKDGTLIWTDVRGHAERDEHGHVRRLIGATVDITERKRAEQRLTLQQNVTTVLAGASGLDDAIAAILQPVCEALGWAEGLLWVVDASAQRLQCHSTWIASREALDNYGTASRKLSFDRGVGLPGRVWASAMPAWISDISRGQNDPRAELAERSGLRTAAAFPIRVAGRVYAVLEFFHHNILPENPSMLGAFQAVADQLSQFCTRKEVEEALRKSEERFRTIIDKSPVPLALNDQAQNITYLNEAFIKTLGYDRTDIPTLADWWPRAYPDPGYRRWVTDTWQMRLDKAKKDRAPFEPMEVVICSKDGTLRTMLVGAVSLTEAFQGLHLVSLYDITARKQAEETLSESEARFRTLVSNIPGAIYRCAVDREWTMSYLSNAIEDIVGYPAAEFTGNHTRSYASVIHPDDRQLVEGTVSAGLRGRCPYVLEYRVIHANGTVRWVYEKGQGVFTSDGKARFLDGAIFDITERKQADELLRLTQFSVDRAVDGVFWVAPDGRILSVNEAACRMLEYSREELTAMTVHDIDPQFSPESWSAHWEDLKQKESMTFESKHWSRTGRVLETEVTVNYLQYEGCEYNCAIMRDISERKRAEAELRQSHAFIRQVIDSDPNFIFAKDRDGRFTLANKAVAECYGTTVDELIGKSDADFTSNAQEVAFFRQLDLDVMDSLRERFIPEEPITDSTGKIRWLQTVKRPILDDQGRATMVLGASTDITERKRVEAELRQREQDLRRAGEERERISEDLHDGILQSIYAIGLGLEACKPLVADLPNKSAVKLNATLERTIGQLNHVLEEVRNFIAGLESQILDGQDFEAVLRTMVHTLAAPYPIPYRIAIEQTAAQNLSTEQAYHVMNIAREALSNSLRHSGASRITVSLKRLRRSVRLMVTDNGVGFNPVGAHDVGHGLANMAARTQKIGGKLTLQSKPRQGAKVLVDIPRRLTDADT